VAPLAPVPVLEPELAPLPPLLTAPPQ
jgi:hypothetical protein